MPDGLGTFHAGFSMWRRALAKAEKAEEPIVFAEAMSEAADWVARAGLDYAAAVAELTDMASSIGLGAADEERVSEILDNAIAIRMGDERVLERRFDESFLQPVAGEDFEPEPEGEGSDHLTAKSTLDAAAWLWFQVGDDPQRFRAFLDKHSDAERADIMRHIKEIEDERDAANER